MRRLIVLALATVVALLVLAACGGDDDSAAPPPAPAAEPEPAPAEPAPEPAPAEPEPAPAEPEPAPEPAPEPPPEEPSEARDTLAIAVQELGMTLETSTYQAASMLVLQATQEPLVVYTPREVEGSDVPVFDNTQFEPGVAESWEIDESAPSITLTLREGVQSPYGNTLTAEDVKWTVERNIALESFGAGFAFSQACVDFENPLTVVDELTVTFNLTAICPNLFRILNWHWESPYDSVEAQAHATEDDPWATEWLTTNSASYGPYNIEDFTPGQSVTLVANPNYWQGEVPIKRIVIRVVPDPGNRQQLLESGEVQYVPDLPRVQLEELAGNPDVKVENARNTRMLYVVTNNNVEPFDNPLVRQAIAYAIPYEDLNTTSYKGTATLASGPVSPLLQHHDASLWQYTYDPDRAKELLAEAGLADGFDATLQYSLSNPGPENAQVAVQIQSALREVGINVELEQATSDAVLFSELLEKKVPFGLGGTAPFVPDAAYQLVNTGTATGPSAFSAYAGEEFEQLAIAASGNADDASRGDQIGQAQEIWAQDMPMIPVLEPNIGLAMDPALTGYVQQPTGFPYLGLFRYE